MNVSSLFKKRRKPSRGSQLEALNRAALAGSFVPMLAAAIASFVTTYNGVLIITDWLAGQSGNVAYVALLVSFVSAGISFALWGMTIRYLRAVETGKATLISLVVLVYLAAMTAVASTYTSFIGLTEQSARALYLMDQASRYAGQVRGLGARALEMENALAFIRPEAQSACIKSETEQQRGLISGSAGTGPISSNLQTLCVRKSALADALAETLAAARPLIDEARTASREIDLLILERSRSLSERELSFIAKARALEAALDALQATDRMRAVRASYAAIGDAVAGLEGLKANVSVGQANALSEIIAAENASASAMRDMLDQIEALALPESVRAELIPASKITLLYVGAHIPQLGLAISLDAFGPLCALLLYAGSLRRIQTPRTSVSRKGPRHGTR